MVTKSMGRQNWGTRGGALPTACSLTKNALDTWHCVEVAALLRPNRKRFSAKSTPLEFRIGDIEALDPTWETFDAVVCVLGIFFLPDMSAGVRHLWRFVRSGGQMAITTWGPRVLEPGSSAFWLAVRDERPRLYKGYNPWDRINQPAALAAMLIEGGIHTAKIAAESDVQSLNSPEDFWTIVLGSGYRSMIEQLEKVSRARVRNATLDYLCKQNVRSVETNAIFAIARKS
jgi:SAM-dependent methyltransferase